MKIHALGCLGFESPRYEEWLTFGPEVFGLQIGDRDPDGTIHLRMDDRLRRLSVHPVRRTASPTSAGSWRARPLSTRPSPS
ncbi:hypothetical protein ACFZCL_11285 [Streptomyces sp. NPDC008159]|uniref:hypothetical protein n=1 Tax=Streptomyces sp. NPDC008159 TaxID=3364817 RepID=UPI0036E850CE